MKSINVIGGGLAGSEAAWQIAERGIKVKLFEMRPLISTGAHQTENLAELVCSNSLGSNLPDRASGLLKSELRSLNSLLLNVAEHTAVPAGTALAVDRNLFAKEITDRIQNHKNIELIRKEVREIPEDITIIATGPLTSLAFSESIKKFCGQDHLYFFDAISPIISANSIDMDVAYRGSRWENGELLAGDYINCPFHQKSDYLQFVEDLRTAEKITLHDFERSIELGVRAGTSQFFEGCLPVEVIASRDDKALAYGPLRPLGLADPRIARPPYAVVQLRQDNLAGDMYNMVGFQTNLTFPEQRRVFRAIPGLSKAEFLRYGQMHRNTFIASPNLLIPTLQSKNRKDLLFAGQITGVEGYMGNIATGLVAGLNAVKILIDEEPIEFPRETMIGALCHYITHADINHFQPMKANFGILPPIEIAQQKSTKRSRAEAYAVRSESSLNLFLSNHEI